MAKGTRERRYDASEWGKRAGGRGEERKRRREAPADRRRIARRMEIPWHER